MKQRFMRFTGSDWICGMLKRSQKQDSCFWNPMQSPGLQKVSIFHSCNLWWISAKSADAKHRLGTFEGTWHLRDTCPILFLSSMVIDGYSMLQSTVDIATTINTSANWGQDRSIARNQWLGRIHLSDGFVSQWGFYAKPWHPVNQNKWN